MPYVNPVWIGALAHMLGVPFQEVQGYSNQHNGQAPTSLDDIVKWAKTPDWAYGAKRMDDNGNFTALGNGNPNPARSEFDRQATPQFANINNAEDYGNMYGDQSPFKGDGGHDPLWDSIFNEYQSRGGDDAFFGGGLKPGATNGAPKAAAAPPSAAPSTTVPSLPTIPPNNTDWWPNGPNPNVWSGASPLELPSFALPQRKGVESMPTQKADPKQTVKPAAVKQSAQPTFGTTMDYGSPTQAMSSPAAGFAATAPKPPTPSDDGALDSSVANAKAGAGVTTPPSSGNDPLANAMAGLTPSPAGGDSSNALAASDNPLVDPSGADNTDFMKQLYKMLHTLYGQQPTT